MKTSSELSEETLAHAHLVVSRDRHAMAVVRRRDGVTILATLANEWGAVTLEVFDLSGVGTAKVLLPFAAFDEILEMIISFGRD